MKESSILERLVFVSLLTSLERIDILLFLSSQSVFQLFRWHWWKTVRRASPMQEHWGWSTCLNDQSSHCFADYFFVWKQTFSFLETFWANWKHFPPSGRMVSSHLCWQSDATMEKSNWKKSHRWDFPALLQYHTSSWNKSLHHWWELPSNASLSKINFSSFSAQWPTDRFWFWRWRWGRGLRGLLMKKEKLCCVSLVP